MCSAASAGFIWTLAAILFSGEEPLKQIVSTPLAEDPV